MSRRSLIIGTVSYIVLLCIVVPTLSPIPLPLFVSDDAAYSGAAIHLLRDGFLSLDGIQAYMDREPGQSVLLAVAYALFGVENPYGVFIVHALLIYSTALVFCRSLGQKISRRVGEITFFLLLTSGSVFHTIFSAYRESLTLSFFLLFATVYFSLEERMSIKKVIAASLLIAGIILTFYTFIYLPPFIALLWLIEKRAKRHIALFLLMTYACVGFWSYRNYVSLGHFQVIDDRRANIVLFVRGEQAVNIRGWEPARCLWAEYISRDYSRVSPSCNFNAVMHRHWPDGFLPGVDYSVDGSIGKEKILSHPFAYLWFSLFEIVELHLPYVGGGFRTAFNVYTLFTQVILFFGCIFAASLFRERSLRFFILLLVYNTIIFSLTDAIPRYLLPIFFCYAFLSAVGYDRLLQRFFSPRRPCLPSSSPHSMKQVP